MKSDYGLLDLWDRVKARQRQQTDTIGERVRFGELHCTPDWPRAEVSVQRLT